MFKYLAGIFASPDNFYADGRLAIPLTTISPRKKVPPGTHPQQYAQMKRSQKATRPPPRTPKFQQITDPATYIVNVLESSSSNDEKESIDHPPARPISSSFASYPPREHILHEGRSSFLLTQIPGAPPVSPVPSSLSLNVNSSRDDNATIWDQLPYASEEFLCCEFIPQKFTKSKTKDWELSWLPEDFWSINTDPAIVYN